MQINLYSTTGYNFRYVGDWTVLTQSLIDHTKLVSRWQSRWPASSEEAGPRDYSSPCSLVISEMLATTARSSSSRQREQLPVIVFYPFMIYKGTTVADPRKQMQIQPPYTRSCELDLSLLRCFYMLGMVIDHQCAVHG